MMQSFGSQGSQEVIRQLEEAGYEAVFVGGAVRDHLLGKVANDFDIATSAFPNEVKNVFSQTIDVGIEHGTVLVLMQNEPIEVTTYRTESTYSDHRRPDAVHFVRTLKDDLQRRDFTINALALTRTGDLIDPFGGQTDLAHGLIRAVGNPDERFNEDALRMLRAIRFVSVLGFSIEEETSLAITRHAEKIRYVSIERIKMEMDKLWTGQYVGQALKAIAQTNLSAYLPLFTTSEKLLHCAPFEGPEQGWAMLMGIGHFTPLELARAYKMSNREKGFLTQVAHAFFNRQKNDYTIVDLYAHSIDVLWTAEKLYHALYPESKRVSYEHLTSAWEALPIHSKDDLQVNGKDLMEWIGQRGGRWVGEWMDKIESAVLHQQCDNDAFRIKEWFLNEYKREK
ncbi:CCA tRNA nucleotidyltransferase [Sporosarcina saromensis]|uniref:CCA-adding enzyme n=2 Tax=Sporosarcina saromensis TaxID=359365 RepID=A0ABU4G3R5_9BACL|nr:CCA tRNA nucleotidyltransferase [Sporosarcina saromensis]